MLKEFNANGTPDTPFGLRGAVDTGLGSLLGYGGTSSPRLLGAAGRLGARARGEGRSSRPGPVQGRRHADKSFGSGGTQFLPAGISPAGLCSAPAVRSSSRPRCRAWSDRACALTPPDLGLLRYTAAGQLGPPYLLRAPRAGRGRPSRLLVQVRPGPRRDPPTGRSSS